MDPMTHTLVGASLAATRLGTKSRYAAAALVVGANLPDVDVLAYFAGSDAALGFRRGWTHGVPALVLLPAALALLLYAWARRRAAPPASAPLSLPWLFGLGYLAILTHPSLDWLNTYGMRWWMPFDGTWYYGDSVFIVDPWLWLLLGTGWLVGRRPTPRLWLLWALVSLPILVLVGRRAPGYGAVLAVVFGLLVIALAWRGGERLRRPAALAGLAAATLFVSGMILLHGVTERRVRQRLEADGRQPIASLMVGPLPADPLSWEFVVESRGRIEHGTLSWLDGGGLRYSSFERPVARENPLWPRLQGAREIQGFLGWARFPWLETLGPGAAGDPSAPRRILVLDARYQRAPQPGFGGAMVELTP